MRITRKEFLRILGSAAALGPSLVAAPATVLGAEAPFGGSSSGELCAATFAPHVGSRFRVTGDDGHVADIELVKVDDLTCDACLEQFSLIFHGHASDTPFQGIFPVEHGLLGRLTLAISPIAGLTPERTIYQACFSRIRGTGRR